MKQLDVVVSPPAFVLGSLGHDHFLSSKFLYDQLFSCHGRTDRQKAMFKSPLCMSTSEIKKENGAKEEIQEQEGKL